MMQLNATKHDFEIAAAPQCNCCYVPRSDNTHNVILILILLGCYITKLIYLFIFKIDIFKAFFFNRY